MNDQNPKRKRYIDATPKVYILQSLRNQHLPNGVRTALGEFIDNSLGEGSGDANNVKLVYNNDALAIIDDGRGIENIASMLTLGDSQNRFSNSDIGNFGYGSKIGVLYLGWFAEIHTVNKKGEYRKAQVDWKKQEENETWHVPYNDKVYPASKAPQDIRNGGTMVIIRDRHEDRKWQWSSLAADLAHVYRPALEAGKTITLINAVSSKAKVISLSDHLEKDILKSEWVFNGEVNGKKFTVRAGERVESAVAKHNGAHFAYGHRVIETVKVLDETVLPSAFYAMVSLSSDWKKSLSSNKTTIAHDRKALQEAVFELVKFIIEDIKTKSQEVRLDMINAQLAQQLSEALNFGGKEFLDRLRYWEPVSWTTNSGAEKDAEKKKKNNSGLVIKLDNLSDNMVWDSATAGGRVIITLNKTLKYVEEAYNNPLEPKAVWALVAGGIVDLVEDDEKNVHLLKLKDDDVDYLLNLSSIDRRQVILHRILSMVPNVNEPTDKQIKEMMEGAV